MNFPSYADLSFNAFLIVQKRILYKPAFPLNWCLYKCMIFIASLLIAIFFRECKKTGSDTKILQNQLYSIVQYLPLISN